MEQRKKVYDCQRESKISELIQINDNSDITDRYMVEINPNGKIYSQTNNLIYNGYLINKEKNGFGKQYYNSSDGGLFIAAVWKFGVPYKFIKTYTELGKLIKIVIWNEKCGLKPSYKDKEGANNNNYVFKQFGISYNFDGTISSYIDTNNNTL